MKTSGIKSSLQFPVYYYCSKKVNFTTLSRSLLTFASGTKVTWGFGESSPPKTPKHVMVAKETEVMSPDMEGPIALVAPELPEDTLLDVRERH